MFALAVAVVAAVTDPTSASDLVLIAIPVAAFAVWAFVPSTPLALVTVAVLVPVVAAQRAGTHQPLMFEVSVLAFVIAFWSRSLLAALALGILALAAPPVVGAIETSGNIAVGIWLLGIGFPWVIGRAILRQGKLAAQLEATRRELARQAMLEERRRIARDVHDFVGHGLAAVMLQVTSARHVLRRDPAAAEEALRSAEDVGRRSMQELRRNVALLRSDEQPGVLPPVPSAIEIPALVDQARAGGLVVELQIRTDLATIAPSVGLALYRIAQEALANAARHAPQARTALVLELVDGEVSLIAQTTGPLRATAEEDPQRNRYGLIGMRERATALGGEFDAGPIPSGWRVSCRLPLERASGIPSGRARRGVQTEAPHAHADAPAADYSACRGHHRRLHGDHPSVAGALVRLLDRHDFHNFGTAVWWALQTVTTVGYGDVVPTTGFGRTVGGILMVSGIALLAVVTASVTAALVEAARAQFGARTPHLTPELAKEIAARLAALEGRFDKLEAALRSDRD